MKCHGISCASSPPRIEFVSFIPLPVRWTFGLLVWSFTPWCLDDLHLKPPTSRPRAHPINPIKLQPFHTSATPQQCCSLTGSLSLKVSEVQEDPDEPIQLSWFSARVRPGEGPERVFKSHPYWTNERPNVKHLKRCIWVAEHAWIPFWESIWTSSKMQYSSLELSLAHCTSTIGDSCNHN